MTVLQQVVDQVRAAAERAAAARQALSVAGGRLDEALDIARRALAGASADSAAQALAILEHVRQTVEAEYRRIEAAELIVIGFHASLVGTGEAVDAGRPSSGQDATQTQATSATARRPVGTWNGQNASEHAANEGRAIGRAPARRKKDPIREVRSTELLEQLFTALSAGGRVLEAPTYKGQLIVLPDGTSIGYRIKSRTTVEPTIDIKTPGGLSLKIHVNPHNWSLS